MFIYFKIFLLTPILLALLSHLPNIGYVIYKRYHSNIKHPKVINKIVVIYFVTLSIVLLIAYFDGLYTGLGKVNDKQSAVLYIHYLITFIFIYIIQYLMFKRFENCFMSNKAFRILIYSLVLLISFVTYGIVPLSNLDNFETHISIWNSSLTTLIVFDVLFFLIFTKQND